MDKLDFEGKINDPYYVINIIFTTLRTSGQGCCQSMTVMPISQRHISCSLYTFSPARQAEAQVGGVRAVGRVVAAG